MARLLRHDSDDLDFGRPLSRERARTHTYALIGALALALLFALAIALRGMYAPPVDFDWPVPPPIVTVT